MAMQEMSNFSAKNIELSSRQKENVIELSPSLREIWFQLSSRRQNAIGESLRTFEVNANRSTRQGGEFGESSHQQREFLVDPSGRGRADNAGHGQAPEVSLNRSERHREGGVIFNQNQLVNHASVRSRIEIEVDSELNREIF